MTTSVLRFRDLKARGIVRNWTTLTRWQDKLGFPKGFWLGPRSRGWLESEVNAWLQARGASTVDSEAA